MPSSRREISGGETKGSGERGKREIICAKGKSKTMAMALPKVRKKEAENEREE